jgi:ribosome-binding factor A
MRKTRRTSRVGEMIRDTLVEVFRHDLKNVNDLMMTSITGVDVSPDLHFARVYLTGLTEEKTKETVEELTRQKGKVRHALGQRIRLRYTPELDFKYDETPMRAGRIEDILAQVMPKRDETVDEEPAPEEGEDVDDDGNDGDDGGGDGERP